MLYSVKMRSAQNGPHELGGKHISGAERMVEKEDISITVTAMLERAMTHSRGVADFIQIKVEKINITIHEVPLLAVRTIKSESVDQGRRQALLELIAAGVSRQAAEKGVWALENLPDSMRGAMLLCSQTGQRLDKANERGVRVSCLDTRENLQYTGWLGEQNLDNQHVREALILASKVADGPGIVAELCWSDDPEYTTGYVSSKYGYVRLYNLKPFGSEIGGRVFFVRPGTDIAGLVDYLAHQPVLVAMGVNGA